MASRADTAGLLLAAGRSLRFGDADKLLAPVDGRPLALHAAERMAGIGLGRLIAVCGTDAVDGALGGLGYRIVRNPAPEDGIGRSIALGMTAVGAAEAVLIVLADMPLVTADHLAAVADHGGSLVATSAGGEAMPPARFPRSAFAELAALAGDRGARTLLAGAVLIEAVAGTTVDVDRPADLSRVRSG